MLDPDPNQHRRSARETRNVDRTFLSDAFDSGVHGLAKEHDFGKGHESGRARIGKEHDFGKGTNREGHDFSRAITAADYSRL